MTATTKHAGKLDADLCILTGNERVDFRHFIQGVRDNLACLHECNDLLFIRLHDIVLEQAPGGCLKAFHDRGERLDNNTQTRIAEFVLW